MSYSSKYPEIVQRGIIEARLDAIENNQGWSPVYRLYPGIPKSSIKDIFYRWQQDKRGYQESPYPEIIGDFSSEIEIDEEAVWQTALDISRRKKKARETSRNHQIIFRKGPICLVFMADQHLGSYGTDYLRLDRDISTILSTPMTYVCHAGDIIDNFIMGRLKDIRLGDTFSVSEEWALAKRVLRLLAPRIVLSVSGNHDLWTYALTNIDYLAEIHKLINPDILYAKYNHNVDITVGDHTHRLRVRHSWRGSSIYNDTHGIERAAKFDKGEHFDIGVGAHTHVSGLYRQFNNGGKTGHAIVCGSYKIEDPYADKKGFPKPNEAAAVAIIVHESGAIMGTNSLAAASEIMKLYYDD